MNQQAEALNSTIQKYSRTVFELLSEKGRNIFFPKKGILSQTGEAKGKKINATIGSAIEDDGLPMILKPVADSVNLTPSAAVSYAPGFGKPELRAKWKEMMLDKNPLLRNKSISLPMTTVALTNGLSMVGYLFVNPGDEILVSDMYWENYDLVFSNAYGGSLKPFNLFGRTGRGMDMEAFRAALTDGSPRIRKVILNFPNNPSGYTPTEKEAAEIVSIIRESAEKGNRILVILDDAYFNLVYEEGVEKQSLFAYLCDIHENVLSVKVDGPTKEDYVWGFRVGYVTYGIKNGNSELYTALEQKTGGAIRGNVSNVANISQSILLKAYNSPDYNEEKKNKYNTLKARYEAVKHILSSHSEYGEFFAPCPFNSGYFMCVRLADDLDGEKVRKVLLDEFDTGVINLNSLIRVAFSAVPESLLPELFENLYLACRKVRG